MKAGRRCWEVAAGDCMDSGVRGKGCEGREDVGTLWYILSKWNS